MHHHTTMACLRIWIIVVFSGLLFVAGGCDGLFEDLDQIEGPDNADAGHHEDVNQGADAPQISNISVTPSEVMPGEIQEVSVELENRHHSEVDFHWTIADGWEVIDEEELATGIVGVRAPDQHGVVGLVEVEVEDEHGQIGTASTTVATVVNHGPVVEVFEADTTVVDPGAAVTIDAEASHEFGYSLSFNWELQDPQQDWSLTVLSSQSGSETVSVTAPDEENHEVIITLTVTDDYGGQVERAMLLTTDGQLFAAPRIENLSAGQLMVEPGQSTTVEVEAIHPDGRLMLYDWQVDDERWAISGMGAIVELVAPEQPGAQVEVTVEVYDAFSQSDQASITIITTPDEEQSLAPIIESLTVDQHPVDVGGTAQIVLNSFDPNGGALDYEWSINSSDPWELSGDGPTVEVSAPEVTDSPATVTVTVTDEDGSFSTASLDIRTNISTGPEIVAVQVPETIYVKQSFSAEVEVFHPQELGVVDYQWTIDSADGLWEIDDPTAAVPQIDSSPVPESTATLSVVVTDEKGFFDESSIALGSEKFCGGQGSDQDPYLVCSAQTLNLIGTDHSYFFDSFRLIDDIDLAELEAAGEEFNIIGYRYEDYIWPPERPFRGTFDGDGHTIYNLSLHSDVGSNNTGDPNSDQEEHLGLFGYVENAVIKNLRLVDVDVVHEGWGMVGGLAGWISDTTITNVHLSGHVEGLWRVGGLVGSMSHSTVSGSSTSGTVEITHWYTTRVGGLVGATNGSSTLIETSRSNAQVKAEAGSHYAGGLVGQHNAGVLINSYATGTVEFTSNDPYYGGGLVGRLDDTDAIIENCYATGAVNPNSFSGPISGGLVGSVAFGNEGLVSDSYWNPDTTGIDESASGEPMTTEQMRHRVNFDGWSIYPAQSQDFPWVMRENPDGTMQPRLAWEEPCDDDGDCGSGACVDQVCVECEATDAAFGGGDGESADPWRICTAGQLNLIGTDADYLDGHFKLFDEIDLDELSGPFNIIAGDDDSADQFEGHFDGDGRRIRNLSLATNSLDDTGLFGDVGQAGHIVDLALVDVVVMGSHRTGALAGTLRGVAENIFVTGTVDGTGGQETGGLAGRVTSTAVISRASTRGAVIDTSDSASVGGLVGRNNGSIEDSYSIMDVAGNAVVGGLIGINSAGVVARTYAAGPVSEEATAHGGLVAINDNSTAGAIEDSYWDSTVNPDDDDEFIGQGLSTDEFGDEIEFSNWDFTDIWEMGDVDGSLRPRLRGESED